MGLATVYICVGETENIAASSTFNVLAERTGVTLSGAKAVAEALASSVFSLLPEVLLASLADI